MEIYLVHKFVEDHEDGLMSRRNMMRRVLHISGGVATAAALLSRLGVAPLVGAAAQDGTPRPQPTPTAPRSPLSVPVEDPNVIAEAIEFAGDGVTLMAYQVRPSGAATPAAGTATAGGALPLVLVCHENRGLTDHIRDVTRRWAKEGYVACAVDLLSREGGTAAVTDPARVPAILSDTDPLRHVADFRAAIAHYQGQDFADATKIGMNGFCLGGGITLRAATEIAELTAVAPFYGPPPPLETVPAIQAAVRGVYSDDPDDFANEGRDELAAALEAAGVEYEIAVYPGTQHAFHNDTGPRYNAEAAVAAWEDTAAFFAAELKG